MTPLEAVVQSFLSRHRVSKEDRLSDRIETVILYSDLDDLEAALNAQIRQSSANVSHSPLPSWTFGRIPANED